MTALTGPFLVNASTGSDTAASGVGPSTAVSFTGLIDASGAPAEVTTTGSTTGITAGHVLFAQTSTGIQFNVVASISTTFGTTTITCDSDWGENFNSTVVCGGKRASITNMVEVFNGSDGFECDVELETDVQWDATTISGNPSFIRKIYSSESGTRRTITSDQQYQIKGGQWYFLDLTFHCDSSTYDTRLFRSESSTGKAQCVAENCIFGDVDDVNNYNYISNGVSSSSAFLNPLCIYARGCLFVNFKTALGGILAPSLYNCIIRDIPRLHYPVLNGSFFDTPLNGDITGCLITNVDRLDNGTDGREARWVGNIIEDLNGTAGFAGEEALVYSSSKKCNDFRNNILTNCSNVGSYVEGRGNIFYNTSGGVGEFEQTITLSSDPFKDASSGDFDFTTSQQALFDMNFGSDKVKVYGFNHAGGGGFTKVGLNGGIDG